MTRRLLFIRWAGALAIAACGIVAWYAHLGTLAASIDAQATVGRTLLNSANPLDDPRALLDAVGRPGIRVQLRINETGQIWRWAHGSASPLERPAGAPPMPPPGAMPPRQAPGSTPAMLAADLAHIPPRSVPTEAAMLTLLPDAQDLLRFLIADIALCGGTLAIVVSLTAGFVRASLAPLQRTTEALERLASGDFRPQSIEPGEAQQIARLARAYNAAADTVARSIEERRAAEAEYRRFLADAGHELRTPLTIVLGFIDIFSQRHGADPIDARIADGMRAEGERMRGLVEKMLLLARLEAHTPAAQRVDARRTIDDAAQEMLRLYPERTISCDGDSSAFVMVDEDDIFEAVRNLLENALRYAPDSDVRLEARHSGSDVLIDVTDGGPGIPAAEQTKIFERFFRGGDRAGGEGSGLGLSIVRRAVERWGGSVELSSGRGSTIFQIRLPAAKESA